MTDEELYQRYCDDLQIPEEDRDELEEFTKQSYGWQKFLLRVSLEDLRGAIIDSLPKWLRRFFRGGTWT